MDPSQGFNCTVALLIGIKQYLLPEASIKVVVEWIIPKMMILYIVFYIYCTYFGSLQTLIPESFMAA